MTQCRFCDAPAVDHCVKVFPHFVLTEVRSLAVDEPVTRASGAHFPNAKRRAYVHKLAPSGTPLRPKLSVTLRINNPAGVSAHFYFRTFSVPPTTPVLAWREAPCAAPVCAIHSRDLGAGAVCREHFPQAAA